MAVTGAFIVPHPPIIMPEIGRGEQRKIRKTEEAYRKSAADAAGMHPDTLVFLSPHSVMYRDYFHISPGKGAEGGFGMFGVPQLRLSAQYDEELVKQLCAEADAAGIAAGTQGERDRALDHGTMVPLRFFQETLGSVKILRIGLSGLSLEDHFRLGICIKRAAEKLERRIVVIASGDLSHRLLDSGPYEYAPEGPEYDKRVTGLMQTGRLERLLDFTEDFCERAGECGHRSFAVMAGCLDAMMLQTELLSYEGPFGVGYAVASFRDACVALARKSLEHYVNYQSMLPLPEGLPEELLQRSAGVFVSLKKEGRLRGCIGTIQGARGNLALEIMENAVSAGLYDPRFYPVEAQELSELVCTVDVLSQPEPVHSPGELDVKRYGVIVTKGEKRGLLLPSLEGVDSVSEQIAIALRKAGIEEEDFTMERFEVVRHY